MEDLTDAPHNGKNIFNLTIHTDGFGASVIFARKKKKEVDKKVELGLEDFNKEEVEQLFLSVAVDPGRKAVFTATIFTFGRQQRVQKLLFERTTKFHRS